MNLLIKRYRGSSYNEIDILCDQNGKEITRRQNVAKSVRFGTKQIMYKGILYSVVWERVSSVS
jgi:hypothetical protein